MKELIKERRNLADGIHKHAGEMWAMGRSDRVAGLPRSVKHGSDFYYLAGYDGERRKEVEREAPVQDSSRNCEVQG